MGNPSFLVLTVAALALTGCVAPDVPASRPVAAAKPVPRELVDEGVAFGLAQQIAKQCRQIGMDYAYREARQDQLEKSVRAQGYTDADASALLANMPEQEIQSRVLAYIQANNILLTDRNSFCAPGMAEIRKGSAIGKYLRVRS